MHIATRNFLPKATAIVALGLITTVASFNAAAVDVYTDPVGFITLTAHGTTESGLSFFGLGMTQIPTNVGLIGIVAGRQLTLSNQTLVAGQYDRVTAPVTNATHFIEITSGPDAGLIDDIVSNNTTSVFTQDDDSGLTLLGKTYKIYPHWTIARVFGASDESGLKPGTSSTADQVLVPNPLTQGFATYFYATATKSLSAGWKLSGGGNVDQSQTTLYVDQGILISKQTDTNLNVKLVGAVKLGRTLIPLSPLNNFAGNVYASSSNTLLSSLLYNGGNQSNSVVAGSVSTADLVLIHDDTTGAYSTYFYATATKSLSAGWKLSGGGNVDQSNTPIPLGANLLIQVQSPRPGFNWTPPAPY